jgi:hypothetical protein
MAKMYVRWDQWFPTSGLDSYQGREASDVGSLEYFIAKSVVIKNKKNNLNSYSDRDNVIVESEFTDFIHTRAVRF